MQVKISVSSDKLLPDMDFSFNNCINGIIGNNIDYFVDRIINCVNGKCVVINNVEFYTDDIYEEMFVYLNKYDVKYKKIDNKVNKMMDMLGLNKDNKKISLFSSGERVLLYIGFNLIVNSPVIIIKDMFNRVDYNSYLRLKNILIELNKKYNKIIFLIDDSNNIINICDNLLVFNEDSYVYDSVIDSFSSDIISYDDLPDIIKFIKLIRKKNPNFPISKDIRDLIKDVYKYVK